MVGVERGLWGRLWGGCEIDLDFKRDFDFGRVDEVFVFCGELLFRFFGYGG